MPKATISEIVATFEFERETKNTIRFEEEKEKPDRVVDRIYVKKEELRALGEPRRIKVTIEAA